MTQKSLIWVNPEEYFTQLAIKEKEREYQIAIEIFITNKVATLHYQDHMNDLPEGTASKHRLLSWLNDRTKNGEIIREGIISSYKKERVDDFNESGFWNPLRLHSFIDFLFTALTDRRIVTDSRALKSFRYSIDFPEWKNKAVAVASLKMLEDLHEYGKLMSSVAEKIINRIKYHRQSIGMNAKIINRAVNRIEKEGEEPYESIIQAKEELIDAISKQSDTLLQMDISDVQKMEEYKLFERYNSEIKQGIAQIVDQGQMVLLTEGD